jgi:hypothetical protein
MTLAEALLDLAGLDWRGRGAARLAKEQFGMRRIEATGARLQDALTDMADFFENDLD